MTVLSLKTFKAHDGKQEDLIQLLRDARSTMLAVDSNRKVRIYKQTEGDDAGNVTIAIEYADMASFREIRKKEQGDPRWQAIGERANGDNRPAETLSYYQLEEI
jgi:hypothetical protein